MLKRSNGRYMEKQTKRCAQMTGAHGKLIDKILMEASMSDYSYKNHDGYRSGADKFVEEYMDDGLFEYVPGGFNKHFKEFHPKPLKSVRPKSTMMVTEEELIS